VHHICYINRFLIYFRLLWHTVINANTLQLISEGINLTGAMPFMKGLQAFRNTQKYLEQGHIVFKHNVKVMMINYNTPKIQPGRTDSSVGIR